MQIDKVNGVIGGIPTNGLEATAALVYAAAKFVCVAIGPKLCSAIDQRCPSWKV